MIGTTAHSCCKKTRKIIALEGLVIFAIILAVYTPSLDNDFVNWDDNLYIYENPHIFTLNVGSIYRMFTAFHAGLWMPLAWISHAVDYAMWGFNPFGHHLTSIILHALNTILFFMLIVLLVITVRASGQTHPPVLIPASLLSPVLVAAGVAALLFGVHPLRVESVVWACERKDVLCGFFYLLSLLYYVSYAAAPARQKRRKYAVVLLMFLCALLSKPMAVTLPAILLLLDFHPLKRLTLTSMKSSWVVWEKIPFLLLSIGTGIVTTIAQSEEAIISLERLPLLARLLNALSSVVFYLEKIVLPLNLAPFYPYPRNIYLFDAKYIIAGMVVLLISGGCIRLVKKLPALAAVWMYYLITLLPVLGIVQAGHQAAADRFTYLPSASIFLLAGIGVLWVIEKIIPAKRKALWGGLWMTLIGAVVAVLSYATIQQISTWKNSVSLWTHAISIFPNAVSLPYCNLGNAYLDRGLLDEALDAYKKALAIDSRDVTAHANAGVAYEKKGMVVAAISKYKDAIAVNAGLALPHYNLGNLYTIKGMYDQAILHYKKALAINPGLFSAHNNLGHLYDEKGLFGEAILEYQRALAINPRCAEAYINLGTTYLNQGMAHEAIVQFKKAIDLNPDDAKAHGNLGAAFLKNNMFDEAIDACKHAIRLNSAYAKAYFNLGSAYGRKGKMNEAIAHFKQAITLEPGYAHAYYNLALAYYSQGKYRASLEHLEKAKALGARVDPGIDEFLQAYR